MISLNSQSRCFFLGAMSSSVVALHMVFPNWLPASECFAAVNLEANHSTGKESALV